MVAIAFTYIGIIASEYGNKILWSSETKYSLGLDDTFISYTPFPFSVEIDVHDFEDSFSDEIRKGMFPNYPIKPLKFSDQIYLMKKLCNFFEPTLLNIPNNTSK